MIRTLSDVLVVSDIDGTLLRKDMSLHGGNLETIRLFTMLGGRFAVATGRVSASVARYDKLAALLAPSITCGGAVIYDFQKKKAVKSHQLPVPVAKRALREVLHHFPEVGAVVMDEDGKAYQAAASNQAQTLFREEDINYFVRPIENLPGDWNKVLFAAPPEMLVEVEKFVSAQHYPGVYFISTSQIYYEMMPEGVSKGSALEELCALVDCPLENTIAISDYYNDIDIMEKAGHAVAMNNAPAEIKMLADEVIAGNEESGVGQYLYKLIQQYG